MKETRQSVEEEEKKQAEVNVKRRGVEKWTCRDQNQKEREKEGRNATTRERQREREGEK